MELYLKDEDLISEEEWKELISSLKRKGEFDDKTKVKKELREKLVSAVEKRVPDKKFGILFSGGVDSAVIAAVCKKLGREFVCYTVGFQGEGKEPDDVVEAKRVAEKLGFDLRVKVLDLSEMEETIRKTFDILKKVTEAGVVKVSVGAVILAAMDLGKEDRVSYFLSGLGAEEIFAGYERHRKAEWVNEECWNGLKGMWLKDLVRDFNLAKESEVVLGTPFLDSDLIKYVMQIPGEWKLNNMGKKVILCEVAEEWLGEFAWRKKKAAQYGSKFDKGMGRVARQEGFKLKKDWLGGL